ncbi:MAG: hypothetical protein VKL39_07785 [Leptolyngbyaceae bacterium]|nr:hypothetical protein [Leptolyngbyaceae bacterium]
MKNDPGLRYPLYANWLSNSHFGKLRALSALTDIDSGGKTVAGATVLPPEFLY